jgi:hypothetical protein
VRAAALGLVALVTSACAGGSVEARTYAGPDADRIAHVEPQTPGLD